MPPSSLLVVSWLFLLLGAPICVLNLYLALLRYPLHRLRGGAKESYRHISGIPLFGSLLVALSLLGLHTIVPVKRLAMGLISIDLYGLHWFLIFFVYCLVVRLGKTSKKQI